MTEQSSSSRTQGSPLKTDLGTTTISTTVVQQIAGIAAQEVEKVQMGGSTSAAVGGFLQSVTGTVTGGGSSGGSNFSKGVSAEVGEEEAAIDLTMTIEYGQSIPQLTEAARRNVINRVESLVGLRVNEVNITVVDVQVPEERPMLGQQEEVEQQARQQEQRA
ncbi:MAG: Asp23/Gls24 family envelope stress response protein [Actinomycetota bacterium]|nr:Asp23/Gls24 family envelope stress response protein [Actinomycetota bacterium]